MLIIYHERLHSKRKMTHNETLVKRDSRTGCGIACLTFDNAAKSYVLILLLFLLFARPNVASKGDLQIEIRHLYQSGLGSQKTLTRFIDGQRRTLAGHIVSVYGCVCSSLTLSVCLSSLDRPSICLSVCPVVNPSFCLSVCLSV